MAFAIGAAARALAPLAKDALGGLAKDLGKDALGGLAQGAAKPVGEELIGKLLGGEQSSGDSSQV
jgi:hypothetical protein